MHRLILAIGTASALFLSSGCETMSSSECASADWYTIGFNDGQNGTEIDMAVKRSEACFEHGFEMDQTEYGLGREDGLAIYCVPQRGYDLGASGGSYNGVCRNYDEASFLAAYEEGKQYYALSSELDHYVSELDSAESRVDYIDDKIATFRREIRETREGKRDADIDYNRSRIAELEDERRDIVEYQMPDLRAEIRFAEKELDRFVIEREILGLPF